MKEIKLTCPFTGLDFTALQDTDGNLYVKHVLTGEDIKVNWNCSIRRYNLPKDVFEYMELVNMSQAAYLLGVSKQRISQIATNQVIRNYEINGQRVFLLEDVLQYQVGRKVGRPSNNC